MRIDIYLFILNNLLKFRKVFFFTKNIFFFNLSFPIFLLSLSFINPKNSKLLSTYKNSPSTKLGYFNFDYGFSLTLSPIFRYLSVIFRSFTFKVFLNLTFFKKIKLTVFRDGFFYIRGLFIIFFIDSCVTDDEPIWEPLEWSLVQTWLLFIFFFSWVVENLICSRYGAYTGRDKRVWFALYKWFWWFELFWMGSLFISCIFILTPFYFEISYSVSNIVTWWNWYNSLFFFKFISLYTLLIYISYILQLGARWLNWKKIFYLTFVIILILSYLFYIQFIYNFFSYFTNANTYTLVNWLDYSNLSIGPNRWHWGHTSRDHFTYHKSLTSFWLKNDMPYFNALFFINLLFFMFMFFLILKWLIFFRRLYTTKDVTYNSLTFNISSLRQFFYLFLLFYLFIILSFINQFYRFPLELSVFELYSGWAYSFYYVIIDYASLVFLFVIY